MKKLFGFILAALLCLQAMVVMAAELPFKDVPKGEWYYDGVKTAYELGLINGKGAADTYKPGDDMTYAEAIKLAACMNQRYTTGKVTLVNGEKNWYDTYVEYCKTNGIISKDYNYGDKVTRAGYIEIFAKALPDEALPVINNVADGFIPDVKMDAPYAAAVYKLVRAGIITGVDEKNNVAPDNNIQRNAVATILARMMDKTQRVTLKLPTAELDPGKLSAEDEKIYKSNKSAMERHAKDKAFDAAVATISNSYSATANSNKVIKSDNYFRYVISLNITNSSISGTDILNFNVLIRVSTDYETVEVYKVGSTITDEDMIAAGWGTRPADFGAEPEE